jgi:hypothetical protein
MPSSPCSRYLTIRALALALVVTFSTLGSSTLHAQRSETASVVAVRAGYGISPQSDIPATFASVLAAIEKASLPDARPDLALHASQFVLVDARGLLTSRNSGLLSDALRKHSRDITALREALQAHMTLRDLLVSKDIPMSQVIGVEARSPTERATVYYLGR